MTLPPDRSSGGSAGTARRQPDFGFAQAGQYLALAFLVAVLGAQDTRHAVIVARHVSALWTSVVAALAAVILLRSGWGVSAPRTREQLEFGTLENSFYEPRRQAAQAGGAVLGGVAGALWWGVNSWILMFTGMRRHQAVRGLWDFELSVLVGIASGALVGAALGLVAGYLWEHRHRRRRRRNA